MLTPLLFILSITIIILTRHRKLHRPWWRFNLPPGPPPRIIIGNLHQMKALWTHSFLEWSRTYGPIISVWFGSQLNVVVSSSEMAKQVLKENDNVLAYRPRSPATAKLSQNGNDLIWSDYGPHYVKVKKICTLELFSPKSITSFRSTREIEAEAMVDSILKDLKFPKEKLILRKYLETVTLNCVSRLVLGKRLGFKERREFKSIVAYETKFSSILSLLDCVWWLSWIPSLFNSNKEFSKHLDRRKAWFNEAIMQECVHTEEKKGFVHKLVELKEKGEMSEETMVGLIWNMLTAGADTVAITVEWAMAELVKHPAAQQKAQQELDSVVGTRRLMSESDITKLPYLQGIVKEVLRLHPPTPLMLPHRASASVRIGGYDLPKGTTVYVNVWSMGRDPANWKDPEEFRPERFLVDDVDMKGQDHRFLPFGSGRRVCPAPQLSINMVTLIMGHLLHGFSWNSTSGEDVDMTETPGLVSYMKTPLQALTSPRLPSELYDVISQPRDTK